MLIVPVQRIVVGFSPALCVRGVTLSLDKLGASASNKQASPVLQSGSAVACDGSIFYQNTDSVLDFFTSHPSSC